jgi:ABC-type glycerol-3-phosphate transport system substrate-binding protein
MNRLKMLIPMLMLAAAIGAPACSSQDTRTTETTTTTQPVDAGPTQPMESSQSTTSTTTNDSGHSSLLGATGNFVWTVVAFPFRVVGDIIGEIV